LKGNRKAVTVRLNFAEQEQMDALKEIWQQPDEKAIIKFAFQQLVKASAGIQKRWQEEQKAKQSSSEQSSDSQPVDQAQSSQSNEQSSSTQQ
jgi:hypothetical protein